ncbi:protein FAR1-RELATED SEQUENCE 5-like [Arachis stenosperma]|uniref:protein FAR1-RELATED SEQUENCE 5-like n=1 Tax=Arachis stenosperma TaxID=217475 RepID=UPI0025AD0DC7|nr:protein FAR1-RELATED SEQUENCE 5-like [Arachis stenosperma]
MEAKLDDGVNRGAGIQEDGSGKHSLKQMRHRLEMVKRILVMKGWREKPLNIETIRKGDNGSVIRRRFFCNKAGLRQRKHYERLDRKRDHRSEMRTNCDAKLSILWDEVSEIWRVRKVILDHNHDLTPMRMVHMINSFRDMNCSAKAQINGMQGHGVPTSKILGYMAGQAGGYSLMGFTKKDAYNYIEKTKREKIVDGDANVAIIYLEGKAVSDPMCMARYNLTDKNMLANLFWADGGSRVNYQHFGDVLSFDSTYKKNKYRRPWVIFSGSNNNKQTTIFEFGLVLDESIESYTWLLENLLEVMCNKKPSVIVTDGCDSMRAAIKAVFSEATHRLCAWYVEKNVTSNVKDEGLRQLFTRWLYSNMEIEEFEAEWDASVVEYRLHDSFWAKETYDKRKMWANAYLKDKFCAGFRTTSRCEGINANVKKFLNSRHSILELVQNVELMVREYRNNELEAHFKSIHGNPVIATCLDPLERFAADVYTRELFLDVKREIEGVRAVNFVAKVCQSTTMVYTVEDYGIPGRPLTLLYDRVVNRVQCPCQFWLRKGYPCRHMFFVLKYEHARKIPSRLVMKRWCKDAKSLDNYGKGRADECSEREFLLRQGALHSASQWFSFLVAHSPGLFNTTMSGIRALCEQIEAACDQKGPSAKGRDTPSVKDPVVVKTKGAPWIKKMSGRKRRCSMCRKAGHTKRHCIGKRGVNMQADPQVDEKEQINLPMTYASIWGTMVVKVWGLPIFLSIKRGICNLA